MSNPEKSIINNYSVTTQKLSQLTDVTHFVNGENLYLVEVVKDRNKKRSAVVTNEVLREILGNPANMHNIIKESDTNLHIMLVKEDFLENLTSLGRYKHTLVYQVGNNNTQYNEGDSLSQDYFNDANKEGYKFIQSVANTHHKHIYKTGDGKIYMEPIVLDSGYSNINDTTYFLDDFVEHLSKRDDIAFLTYLGRWDKHKPTLLKCPLKGDEKDIGGVIYDIEHHLEEGESQPSEKETITVVYYPKQDDIKKILAWNDDIDGRKKENLKRKMYFLDVYITKDLLGGQQFVQNPPELEEVDLPKRKFKH